MKSFKMSALLVWGFLSLSSPSWGDIISDNISANLKQDVMDTLAQDLGALMGGGSFHQGKALGFPVGFDVGIHVPVLKIQSDNLVLNDKTSIASLWAQGEIGLPAKINLMVRGGRLVDTNLMGGGVRYGILSPALPGLPALSVSALYSKAEHDYFDLKTYSANAVLSIDFPFIHPYIGGGYDRSELKPSSKAFDASPVQVSRDLKGESDGYRAEFGVNISPFPFTYITLGYGLANGNQLYHGGVGAKF